MNEEKSAKREYAYTSEAIATYEVFKPTEKAQIVSKGDIRNMALRTSVNRSMWQIKNNRIETERLAMKEKESVTIESNYIKPLTLSDTEKINDLLRFTNCQIVTRDKRIILGASDIQKPHRKYELTAWSPLKTQYITSLKGNRLHTRKVYNPIKSNFPENKDNRKYNIWACRYNFTNEV